ncbi:MAG: flagellar filament outer layer protein FlaA [Spirochaetaceae bacterium]|nr:flagellar filament outer layer protein FlaA [Spirochaetaceae bacterium]
MIIAVCAVALVAQDVPEVGTPNATDMNDGLPQQALSEVSVDKFEMEGFWRSNISSDAGFSVSRLFEGGPANKKPIEAEADLNIPDTKVLGTKVDFLRRGNISVYITSARPIPVEGIVKTLSVWVAGRNYNHKLFLLIQDFHGRNFEIYMGRLNFQGWKNLTAVIPPQQELGMNGIVQQNYHYSSISGIKVTGFRIECDPMDAYGSYYVYMDDLRAVTDLFTEDMREADDPFDDW